MLINELSQQFINPAEAGANRKLYATLFGQQRWMSVLNSYSTIGAYTSCFLDKLSFGIGVRYFHDVNGVSKMDNLMASYNSQIKLKGGSLNIGTRFGWHQFRTHWTMV
ncbi:MAG: type IX secretion system membrane protein PorP/SprF [Flavobacteriales bacterium]|nr:type IX secretion system membrane protein PorP/SprF [Flavobacteriales bacterium]